MGFALVKSYSPRRAATSFNTKYHVPRVEVGSLSKQSQENTQKKREKLENPKLTQVSKKNEKEIG